MYLTLANVKMVQSVLLDTDWDYLFPIAKDIYSYDAFLHAVARFPKFCAEGDSDLCKRELCTFFAHTAQECGKCDSNYWVPKEDVPVVSESTATANDGDP